MSECASCKAAVPDDAAFCPFCGATRGNAPAPASMLNPEAERALRAAAQSAQGVVANLGPDRTLGIVGGVLGVLGTILPYYNSGISVPAFANSTDTSVSLLLMGTPGAVILILAIILSGAPIAVVPSRSLALAGFGLSAAILGELVFGFLGFSQYGVIFSYGIGFYCALIGFGLLCYVYLRRARE